MAKWSRRAAVPLALVMQCGCKGDAQRSTSAEASEVSSAPGVAASVASVPAEPNAVDADVAAACARIAKLSPPADPECARDMTEVKQASAQGFRCVTACLAIDSELVAGLCSIRCADDPKLAELGKAKARASRLAWTREPSTRVSDSVERYGTQGRVDFTLELPDGFIKDEDAMFKSVDVTFRRKTDTIGTSVLISGLVHPLASALSMAKTLSRTIVESRGTDEAYTVVQKTDVVLEVLVRRGPVSCTAEIISQSAVEMSDVLLPWLTSICESVAEKKR